MSQYFILYEKKHPMYCVVTDRRDSFDKIWYPSESLRMGEFAPENHKFHMSEDFSGIVPSDFIRNNMNYQLITSKVKTILDEHTRVDIEYIPFDLINHKGRVVEQDCYIMNVIGTVDCVDRELTEGEESPMQEGEYQFIDKLILLENKIGAEKNMFRIDAMPHLMIIRKDLKEIFEKNGVTGLQYIEVGTEFELS